MNDNAKSIVAINEHELDRECINLPANYLQFATHAAECRKDLQEVKAALEVTQADRAKHIRQNPGVYGLEKVTESAVSDLVLRDKEVKAAQQKLIDSQYELDIASAAVSAMEHKKRALTMLVELHAMGWFSNVKMSERGKEAVEEMTKRKTRKPVWRDED